MRRYFNLYNFFFVVGILGISCVVCEGHGTGTSWDSGLTDLAYDCGWIGCLEEYSPQEYCEIAVEDQSIYVSHINAILNCCINEVDLDIEVQPGLIKVIENEVFYAGPCDCYCNFDVHIDIYNVPCGIYTLEVWTRYEGMEMELKCSHSVKICKGELSGIENSVRD